MANENETKKNTLLEKNKAIIRKLLDSLPQTKEQKEKYKSILKIDCIQVFKDHYRINIWIKDTHPFVGNYGKIDSSYFVTYFNNTLLIK